MFFSRGKNKLQNPLTFRDVHDDMVKELEEDSPYNISKPLHGKICSMFFKEMMDFILYEAGEFIMPLRLGNISVAKRKNNSKTKLSLDFGYYNDTGKKALHTNEHTKGFRYLFKWSKKEALVKNQKNFRFIPSRDNKRLLAKLLKSGEYDYLPDKN